MLSTTHAMGIIGMACRRHDRSVNLARRLLRSGIVLGVLLAGTWGCLGQSVPADSQLLRTRAQEFEARLEATAGELKDNRDFRDFSQQQRKQAIEFVTGNMLFALAHEMGHVFITEMGLPVLGQEEDAADSHAVLAMLQVGNAFSHRVLVDAVKGWFVSDQRARDRGDKSAAFDEHGLDRERAYKIVCLMVGFNADEFADLVRETRLPQERQDTCEADYSNASWSWEKLLEPHRRLAIRPKTKIGIIYDDATGDMSSFARLFRSIRLLETAADVAADGYVWRRPFVLEMRTCGKTVANWDVKTAKLTLCYELAAEFAQVYRAYIVSHSQSQILKPR
jgi:hypothetical protein